MKTALLCVMLIIMTAATAFAEGGIAQDPNNRGQLIPAIKLSRQSNGTLPNRCDTVAASGTITYSVKNVSVISYSATDASYAGVTVIRSWDSDTAYMPIFTTNTEIPGSGVRTVTITNVTSANAIICIERQVNGDMSP